MFDELSARFEDAVKGLRGQDTISETNVDVALKDVRRALLEADVSLPVVRRFVKRVEERCLGLEVVAGVSPDQKLVKVVRDELVALMGGEQEDLNRPAVGDVQVILMAGLQGVGKTTAAAKLAKYLKNKGMSVTLGAADVYRPAAIEQLIRLGERIDVPVFSMEPGADPVDIAKGAVAQGSAMKTKQPKAIIVDTAGRLTIDDALMTELKAIKEAVNPTDTLLVVDAMTGQEAATLTKSFNDAVDITGAMLTKMDGDSRGGAALSTREVSGRPIKFVGTGENMDDIEAFYPDRMAGRILGMGDVLTLVEKAEEATKGMRMEELERKIAEAKFDLNDYLELQEKMASVGTLGKMMKMMPGMSKVEDKQLVAAEKQLKKSKLVIQAFTEEERANPESLMGKDSEPIRKRVAEESGQSLSEVNDILSQFLSARDTMQKFMEVQNAQSKLGMSGIGASQQMIANLQESRKVTKGMVRRKKKQSGSARGRRRARRASPRSRSLRRRARRRPTRTSGHTSHARPPARPAHKTKPRRYENRTGPAARRRYPPKRGRQPPSGSGASRRAAAPAPRRARRGPRRTTAS